MYENGKASKKYLKAGKSGGKVVGCGEYIINETRLPLSLIRNGGWGHENKQPPTGL
jgi:hypothetical protein